MLNCNKPFEKKDFTAPHLVGNNSQYQKFLILTTRRTGSGLLVSLLRSKDVVCFTELAKDINVKLYDYEGYPNDRMKFNLYRNNNLVGFFDDTIFRKYAKNIEAVGFKIMYHHATDGTVSEVWPYLRNIENLKIIHLKRRNLLNCFFSLKIAEITDMWWTRKKEERMPAEIEIKIDHKECENFFKEIERDQEKYKKYFSKHDVLDLYYEDLVSNREKECGRVMNFLNLPTKLKLDSNLIKMNNAPLDQVVLNYDELKEKFRGSKWELFFK